MKYKCCSNKKDINNLTNLAGFLKIIAEENRLKILCLLRKGDKCVCEIWQQLNLSQNLTSSHLKVLRDAELIGYRKKGLNVYYSINKKNIKKYNSILTNLLQTYEK
jgi:ArsR family transcriptional regulator